MPGVDVYGHCCLCHNNMILNRVVGGKIIQMFSPDYDSTQFVLNNNSKCNVSMCKPCKSNNDLSDPKIQEDIMQSLISGWQMEQDMLLSGGHTTQEECDKVMCHHKNLNILFHSEGIDDYVILNRLKELENVDH